MLCSLLNLSLSVSLQSPLFQCPALEQLLSECPVIAFLKCLTLSAKPSVELYLSSFLLALLSCLLTRQAFLQSFEVLTSVS